MTSISPHYKQPPILVPERPLTFARELPRHRGPSHTVEVSIHPDLRITVTDLATHNLLLRGRYERGAVDWYFVGPTLHDERATLASDVRDILRVFELQLLDVRSWTSEPRTARALA